MSADAARKSARATSAIQDQFGHAFIFALVDAHGHFAGSRLSSLASIGHQDRNHLIAVAAVDAKIRVQCENLSVPVDF